MEGRPLFQSLIHYLAADSPFQPLVEIMDSQIIKKDWNFSFVSLAHHSNSRIKFPFHSVRRGI